MFKHKEHITEILFFDLEFYVPPSERDPSYGFSPNPFREGHLLLGGTFISFNPFRQISMKPHINNFWLWNYENEREMLNDILTVFKSAWKVTNKHRDQADPTVSGIGVSRIDIGYLYSKCIQHEIAGIDELFDIFYKLRIIELESMAIPFFKYTRTFVYTKSTHDLLNRFNIDRTRVTGTKVWDYYESGNVEAIEKRNADEVQDCLDIYMKMMKEITIKKVPPKMAVSMYTTIIDSLKKQKHKNVIIASYTYTASSNRYVLEKTVDNEMKYEIFKVIVKSGYWIKPRQRPSDR
jgi:hypothetical protein